MEGSIGYRGGVSRSYFNIAEVHMRKGNLREALIYLNQSRSIADSIHANGLLVSIYEDLATVHDQLSNHKMALAFYKQYTQIKDSLFNEDKSKEIGKLEAKYEFEKEEAEKKSAGQMEQARTAAIESRRDNLQYSGILIFLMLMGISLLGLGKLAIPIRLVEGMIFFTFLLTFEFLLVLIDPYIENFSGGEPAYKLLFNALLAAMIFLLHAFFENTLKRRIVS